MSDFHYHGSYPYDAAMGWDMVCEISIDIAIAFYNDALLRNGKERVDPEVFKNYLNKCFTVVRDTSSHVVAIYKHDFRWSLIEADKVAFLKAWSRRPSRQNKEWSWE
jgi:hypothetical protein